MKNSILLLIGVVVLLIVGIGIYGFIGPIQHQAMAPTATSTATSSSSTQNLVAYSCEAGKNMTAMFDNSNGTSTLALALSDGRNFPMIQAMSGSGVRYESAENDVVFIGKGNDAFVQEDGITTYDSCVAGTSNGNTSGSTTYTDQSGTFSFAHPSEFTVVGGGLGFNADWRQQATSSGRLLVSLTIPKTYEPNTNFGDAKFTVGTSADPLAASSCTTAGNGNPSNSVQTVINGVPFTKITFSDAGAGNRYDTTSYRTVKNNQCYAVEYTIHSTNIQNYPSGSGIKEFDKAKVQGVLEDIVQSFKFL